MAKKRVSLRDVAKVAGVSVATASRVVAGKGNVSEEARQLVMNAVQECGYVMESHTGEDADASEPFVGMVAYTCDSELYAGVIDALSTSLTEQGSPLVVIDCAGNDAREQGAARRLRRMGAAIIVFMGCRSEGLSAPGGYVPFMLVAASPWDEDDICSVTSDDYVGGRLAAQELLRKGCVSPIVLANRRTPPSVAPRVVGFIDAFAEVGISVGWNRVYQGDPDRPSAPVASDLIKYLRAKGVEFDSVFACTDWRASGAVSALAEIGVDVPGEVKVVGYDGTRISRYGSTPITTVQQDAPAIARATLDMVNTLLAGKEPPERHVMLPVRLVQGQTT